MSDSKLESSDNVDESSELGIAEKDVVTSENESSSSDATEVLKEEIENKVIPVDDANPVGLKFKVGKRWETLQKKT